MIDDLFFRNIFSTQTTNGIILNAHKTTRIINILSSMLVVRIHGSMKN